MASRPDLTEESFSSVVVPTSAIFLSYKRLGHLILLEGGRGNRPMSTGT